jgi:hypothetical protein
MSEVITRVLPVLSGLLSILLAAFFAFVGYWKAFGPIEALAEHHARVTGFPNWFTRVVGWSELACAVGLMTPVSGKLRPVIIWVAGALFINQVVAMSVQVGRGDAAEAEPQNLVLLSLLSIIIAVQLRNRKNGQP